MSRNGPPFSAINLFSSAFAHACILLRGPDFDCKIFQSMSRLSYWFNIAWKPSSLSLS